MIKTLVLAGVAVLALAGSAVGQPRHDMPMDRRDGPGGMGGARDFVMRAGASDRFEILEGQMAASRARDPALRRFGTMMVRDHTRSTMKIKAAVRAAMGRNPPPPMLTPDQESMVAELRAARGRDFDRTYVRQQMQAHEMALDLMRGYASNGDDPRLREVAGEIQPVVEHHLSMLRDMREGR